MNSQPLAPPISAEPSLQTTESSKRNSIAGGLCQAGRGALWVSFAAAVFFLGSMTGCAGSGAAGGVSGAQSAASGKEPMPAQPLSTPGRTLMHGDPRVTAHDFFLRARQMENEGNAAVALGYLRIAYEYDPASRDLCFLLVDRLRDAGLVDTALVFGDRCLTLEGKPEATEYKLMGELHLRRGDLQQAVLMYDKALELDDGDRDLLYTLSSLYESLKQPGPQAEVLGRLLPLLDFPQRLVTKQIETLSVLGRVGEIPALLAAAWEKSGNAWFGERLADWHEQAGDWDSLRTTVQRLEDENPEVLHYQIRMAKSLALAGKEDSALGAFEKLLRHNPDEREVIFPYAALLFDRKRYAEAKPLFAKLVKQKPAEAVYQYFLGSSAWELKEKDLAESSLQKALDLEPRVAEYWVKLSMVMIKRHRLAQVDSLLSLLQSPDSADLPAHFLRGSVYTLLSRRFDTPPGGVADFGEADTALTRHFRRESVEAYRSVLSLDKDNRRGLFEMAVGLERLGKKDSALGLLKTLTALDTNDATAANYLGYMLVEGNVEMDLAGRMIARALALEPDNGAYLDSQGWWHYQMGEYEAALRFIKLALEKMPHDTTVLEHYALILERLGQGGEAHKQWQEILKIDPHNSLALRKVN